MKKKNMNLGYFVVVAVWYVAVISIISVVISVSTSDAERENYCDKVYPYDGYDGISFSKYGTTSMIEEGYIKCCRPVYINHERDVECKIFPYEAERYKMDEGAAQEKDS